MPARSTTPGLGAVACTPYGGALPSDHISSMTLTETQMRLPCGQWNSFATSTSLTSLPEDGAAERDWRMFLLGEPASTSPEHALVSRFRSSHRRAVRCFANFG